MKKLVIFISSLLMSSLLYFFISDTQSQIIFSSFPTVDLYYVNPEIDKSDFEDDLEDLANQNDVIIAKRIVIPQKSGEVKFYYKTFGDKEAPPYINIAPDEVLKTNDDLAATYIIIGKALSQDELYDFLSTNGNQTRKFGDGSSLDEVIVLFGYPAMFFILVVSFFVILAISIINRLNETAKYGIKLISGQRKSMLLFKDFIDDLITVILALLMNVIIFGILFKAHNIFNEPIMRYFLTALIIYLLGIVLVSLIVSFLFFTIIKYKNLMQIVKGRLPIKSIMTVLIVSQILSFLIVAYQFRVASFSYPQIKTLETSASKWDEYPDLVSIAFNLNAHAESLEEDLKRSSQWYDFLDNAYEDGKWVLDYSNIANYFGSDIEATRAKLDQYDPDGNTMIVSNTYLEKEQVDHKTDFSDLEYGQFGLILPEKLKANEESLVKIYEDYVNETFGGDGDFKAKVEYVSDNQKRFIFNTTIITDKQYLIDPAIIVISPKSTGASDRSLMFWQNIINNFIFFDNYEYCHKTLDDHDLLKWVSYIKNSRSDYYERLSNEIRDIRFSIIGSIFTILTSLLLFNSIVITYFKEFRRENFIKRISGLSFFGIHKRFIIIQCIVFFLSLIASYKLTEDWQSSLITFLVFVINSLIILYVQNKKENKQSMTILKGE
ncbi:bacteriocin-associated integral membrane family protein [Anaerococcus provencensis]|uniref:bacteriocin-associated integral membrane family protein n=1 Tax=Anaerococcus provencensis TaxID=938293 RepID=UPI0002E9CE40|nr:DUF1430 domain-containing protein [Anaerococcus provencensis]